MPARIATLFALAILSGLSACSFKDGLKPYRIDVRQGNYVTPEMVAQLKKGMTPDQVRFVLGTPLVVDPFHTDRWDYPYRFDPRHGEAIQNTLTVRFRNGVLFEVVGSAAPAESRSAQPSRVIEIGAPSGPEGR